MSLVKRPRVFLVIPFLFAASPALLTTAALAQPAAQTPAPPPLSKAAKAKEMAARKAFGAGDWARALELYSDLYAETLHPIYLRNIARSHQRLRNPQKAIDLFQEYLTKYKPQPDEQREIEGFIKEMETLRQEQAQAAAPGGAPAAATSASAPSATAAPAASPVQSTPGTVPPPPVRATVDLTQTHTPTPVPDEPVYKRWWFWTGVGAVVAGGTVTAFLLTRDRTPLQTCPAGVMGGCK